MMNPSRRVPRSLLFLFLPALLFLAAACTAAAPTATPRPATPTATLVPPTPTTVPVVTSLPTDDRLNPALLQAYFLSVDNFAAPVMMGQMGIPFQPPMENIMALMQKAGLQPEMMPKNPGMVMAIYTSGEPKLAPGLQPDPGPPPDFSTMRWDPAGFDTTITTRDQAMVIMKFLEWAKYFHKAWSDESILFTPPLERMLSNVFMVQAKVIANFSKENLMGDSGFVSAIKMEDGERAVVDDTVDPADQAHMLWALADLVGTLKNTEDYPNLQLPGDDERLQTLSMMMDNVFAMTQAQPITETKDKGLGIVALVWYAAATDKADSRAAALDLIRQYADSLGENEETAFEYAASIRGLLEAWRVTGNASYRDTALDLWGKLDALWDAEAGVYRPTTDATTYTYTPWDAGLVIGALGEVLVGALEQGLPQTVAETALSRYLDFHQRFIVQSPFSHTSVPTPGRAGIFVGEIQYDAGSAQWTVTNGRYVSAGSQYAANEMIWLEGTFKGRLTGYPDVPDR